MRKALCFRLSEEAVKALEILCARLGVSKTAIVEMAVRKYLKNARQSVKGN